MHQKYKVVSTHYTKKMYCSVANYWSTREAQSFSKFSYTVAIIIQLQNTMTRARKRDRSFTTMDLKSVVLLRVYNIHGGQ